MKRIIILVMALVMMLSAVPASAHIPHTEYDGYETHTCYPPVAGATLTHIHPVVQVRTNVTGWHDVGASGWYDGYSGTFSVSQYVYLSAYNYKTVYLTVNVPDVYSNGIGYVTYSSAWLKFISSLEHNNVYVDTVRVDCTWNWPTG